MENQIEKQMENELETGGLQRDLLGLVSNRGFSVCKRGLGCGLGVKNVGLGVTCFERTHVTP